MRARELFEWGKIIAGVNSTADVKPGEIQRQGKKMGFDLSPDGLPPIWTGFDHSTGAKDTPVKGQKAYDDDGVHPKDIRALKEGFGWENAGQEYFQRKASEYHLGMGATIHPEAIKHASEYIWRFERNYPIEKLSHNFGMTPEKWANWMQEEINMWSEEGVNDRYDDELKNDIREPIIVIELPGDSIILDGCHRTGACVMTGRNTIPAIVGVPKENLTETAIRKNGNDYFSDEAWDAARGMCSGNSRAILIHMTPDDFLKVANQGHDETKMLNVEDVLIRGGKFHDIPFLLFVHDGDGTAQVVGHEGRHRMKALKSLGVTAAPVVLKHIYDGNGQTMRWSAMGHEDDRDFFRDDWPVRLYAENARGVYIRFPVSDMRPAKWHQPNHPLVNEAKETFKNEFDREISVEVKNLENERDGKTTDGIWIDMIGPDSEVENHITRKEAEVMHRLLGDALRSQKHDCKTPGAMYQSHMTDSEVGIDVVLPPEVKLDLTPETADDLDDRMHDAMEEILADLLKDADWDEAKKNDPANID